MDIGVLLLRLLIAFILFAHSTQKLLGWFQGPGRSGAKAVFEKLGQRPAPRMVLLASTCELLCVASMLTGFLTPIGVTIGAAAMLVAGSSLILANRTFWNVTGGGEYPLALSAIIVVVGFTGPGAYSADAFFNLPWFGLPLGWQVVVGIGAMIFAMLGAIPPIFNAKSNIARDREMD